MLSPESGPISRSCPPSSAGASATRTTTRPPGRRHRFLDDIPAPSMFDTVFAPWTRQNHPGARGRYRVLLAHDWDSRGLPDGRHTLEVEAIDTRGNLVCSLTVFSSPTDSDPLTFRLARRLRCGARDPRRHRTRLLELVALAAGALFVDPKVALARLRAPSLARLSVRNIGRRYSGDRRLFASVSPGVKGRDRASIRFALDRPATVRLEAVRTALRRRTTVWQTELRLQQGAHRIWWKPDEKVAVGTYVMRLTVDDGRGNRKSYGGTRPGAPERSIAPVVRVLGVEAAFEKRSYMPLEPAKLDGDRRLRAHHRPVSRLRHRNRVHRSRRRDARPADRPAALVRVEAQALRAAHDHARAGALGSAASTPPS